MHSVAQAAKDAGQPLRRSQLCWVLERAKGDERVAISLATSQASARRALPVLRALARGGGTRLLPRTWND